MEKHSFKITISGTKQEAGQKAEALATLAAYLDAATLKKLAEVVKSDPGKVALAKKFLGV
ncbi:MAG: hypothetical protein HYZ14_03060 [Bacteroidetes bacterium]|nr:hypothetical protein [Bacteroidota bacterium]